MNKDLLDYLIVTGELDEIISNKKCPLCSSDLIEIKNSIYKYYCSNCNNSYNSSLTNYIKGKANN